MLPVALCRLSRRCLATPHIVHIARNSCSTRTHVVYCAAPQGAKGAGASAKPKRNIQQLGQAAPVDRKAVVKKAATAPEIKHIAIDLPKVNDFKVKSAVYVKSSTNLKECPPEKHPEFAVIGRSNVGKSSLINAITENSKLAKVSKEPGMTKCINHFLINNNWYLVDLPGYGYAKSSKEKRMEWFEFTQEYFLKRDVLAHVLLLVDASVPTQAADLECANWLGEAQVPFSVVFTKADKASPTATKANMQAFKRALAADWDAIPPCFQTSSRTGDGKSALLQYLAGLRLDYLNNQSK